jgi:pseudouridine-5'-phosphate glycosidase
VGRRGGEGVTALPGWLVPSPEVHAALADGRGVVALETTLLAHGLPAARRLEVARVLDAEVRAHGAVPAVIAVVDGKVRVGLEGATLERLCTDPHVTKCGERDVAVALARGGVHATTVSSTTWAAAQAGVRVFATGGIGGIHRGFDATLDESQDLGALARHPVAVISAGAKAILDLPRTMERLETLGVLVVGYRCQELPGFYTTTTGLPLEHTVEDLPALASVARTRLLDLRQGGLLVFQPVPAAHAMDPAAVDQAIASALAQAGEKGVRGKPLTPFLLAALERVTSGRSVETNIALVRNNASLAGQLASALAHP